MRPTARRKTNRKAVITMLLLSALVIPAAAHGPKGHGTAEFTHSH